MVRLAMFTIATFLTLSASRPVTVTASPRFATAPRTVVVTARVAPHADNRKLLLIVNGPRYQRVDIDLEGASAPRTHQREFLRLPAGRYEVAAIVYRTVGPGQRASEHRAAATVCLSGIDVTCVDGW